MSESASGSEGPQDPLAGFLWGNVDENHKLDADYLDADELNHLEALGGDRLGLDDQLEDLQEGKSRKRSGAAGQEVQKLPDAVNFSDEEEMVDYTPPAGEDGEAASKPNSSQPGDKSRKVVKLSQILKPGTDLKLPILAKHGNTTLLRFSELFTDPIKPERYESRRVRRRIADASEEDPVHELGDIASDSDSGFSSQTESMSDDRPGMPSDDRSAAESGAENPERTTSQQEKARTTRVMDRAKATLARVSSACFDGVYLADWEDSICWDDVAQSGEQINSEQESDDEGPATTAQILDVEMDSIESLEEAHAARDLQERIQSSKNATTSYVQNNQWLAEAGWEEDVRWDSNHSPPSSPVLPDMNDPNLIFQLLRSTEDDDSQKAAALVLEPKPKVKLASAPALGKGRMFSMLARHNLSQDEDYAKKKAKKGLQTMRHRHAIPALQLATLPPRYLDNWELWHRPRGLWVPSTSKGRARVKEGDKSTVKILSLVGHAKLASSRIFKGVDLTVTPLNKLWDVVQLWYRGGQPHALPGDVPIAETGVPLDANMDLSLVVSGLRLLPTEAINNIPEAAATTPTPVAIQKTKQLTACDGHLILLEYLEEAPLLLSRPGMSVRLATYFRKKKEGDPKPEELLTGRTWEKGTVEILAPTEDPPFMLGDIQPGSSQLAIECNMYRAPAKSHPPGWADFLLVRAASGALSVREITGTVMVGQEEPLRRIPVPNSKECKELEEARMVAHVMRELRRQKFRNEKKKGSELADAVISVRELMEWFPTISEGVIRSRLRDRCNCVPQRDDSATTFKLADGVTIADERELRQLVRPEEWCSHERMRTGMMELNHIGLAKHERLAALSAERFKMAAEQLSPPEEHAAVIHELEAAVQSAPWVLTDNFISAMREGRGALALTGAGDPTARGEGFSYFKEAPKAPGEKAVDPQTSIPRDGNITGTNNDLRRLTMAESKAVLLKLGLDEESIKGLSRWQRIAAVRDLSTAAAGEEEGELGKLGNKYARVARASLEEQQRARRHQARQIFARQLEALAGRDEDSGSDGESWGDELEKELAGEEEDAVQSGSKKGKKGKVEDDDELDDVEELRKGGFLEGDAATNLAKAAPKLEAKAGDIRIKRTIKFRNADDAIETRVIYYTDKDKKNTLNDFYRRDGRDPGLGFGKRVISGGGNLDVNDNPNARKTKKNMAKIQCKACGQMGHYKSNKVCPLYEQTHAKATKAKEAKLAEPDSPIGPVKLTLNTSSLTSPKAQEGKLSLQRMRSEIMSGGSPNSRNNPRKYLGQKVLQKALTQTKKIVPESIWIPFRSAVTKASAPDYNDFVPAAEEMHMDKIEKKAKQGAYSSTADFLADFERIVQNASIYNKPGNGKYGGPAIVTWAEQLMNGVRQQLETETLRRLSTEIESIIDSGGAEPAAVVAPQEPIQEPAQGGERVANLWVQCTNCQKWRKVSQKVNDETVPTSNDAPWHCSWDYERPGASCELPEDQDE